jgi:hypothetical protein
VVDFLKKNFIIGLVLVLCFILFISAGAAGEGSEVVVGSIGFFGVIALLPLFLYLVVSEAIARREEVHLRSEIAEDIGSQEIAEQPESERPAMVSDQGISPPPPKDAVDKDFIEGLRAEQLDVPDRVSNVPEDEHPEHSHDLIGGLGDKGPARTEEEIVGSQEKESEKKKEDDDSEEEKDTKEEE